jgi:branched-chain amino acid transport system substrate-binding protein
MRGRFFLVSLICLFMISGPAFAGKKQIIVGLSATYTGGMAAIGKHVSDGMVDLLRYIGAHGGIEYKDPQSGKKEKADLKVLWEDNQYNVAKAVSAYKSFKARGAHMILGFGSTPGEACAASASRDKVPYLTWYGYASPAGYAPKPQYYWAVLPSVGESATAMIKWFVKEKWKGDRKPRIGLMATNIPSWRVLAKKGLMDKYIESAGAELAGIEFTPVIVTDLSIPINRLVKDNKADCILHMGILSDTVVLAKDIKRLAIDTKKVTIINNLSAWDESLFKSIPQEVEGLYGELFTATKGCAGLKRAKTVAKWAGRKESEITANYLNGFMGSWVVEVALKRALEKSGYEAVTKDGLAIKKTLETLKCHDYGGLAPELEVKFLEKPFFYNYDRVVEARGGKFVEAGKWTVIEPIKGALK